MVTIHDPDTNVIWWAQLHDNNIKTAKMNGAALQNMHNDKQTNTFMRI